MPISTLFSLALTTCLQDQVVIPPQTPALVPVTPVETAPVAPGPRPYAPVDVAPVAPGPRPYVEATPAEPQPYAPVATSAASPASPTPYTPPYAITPYPLPPPAPPLDPTPAMTSMTRKSRFSFAFMPGFMSGNDGDVLASLNTSFFFGVRLRSDRWALGYQFSMNPVIIYTAMGMPTRHYLTAWSHFAKRGYASFGAGLALTLVYPAAAEFESRIGVRFGPRRRAVFGGQVRVSRVFGDHDRFIIPQFGLFLGFSIL